MPDDVVEDLLDVDVVDAELPGIVAALTALRRPTAASAAAAAPTVRRFSSRRAASRAWMRVVSMFASLWDEAGVELGTGLEIAESWCPRRESNPRP